MPFYPASYPLVGQVFVLMAFVAVVFGTLGNVTGASDRQPDDGRSGVPRRSAFVGYADPGLIVVFMMLLLTLAFRPQRPLRRMDPLMRLRRGTPGLGGLIVTRARPSSDRD